MAKAPKNHRLADDTPEFITVRLLGTLMDDGRMYVKSEDLPGFHFVLEEDEIDDPGDVLMPALSAFLDAMLSPSVSSGIEMGGAVSRLAWTSALSLYDYAHRHTTHPPTGHVRQRERSYNLVASVA